MALVGERWLANGVVGLGLAGAAFLVGSRSELEDDHQFVWSNGLLLGLLFLLSPVANPWYFVGLVPFLSIFPLRSWLLLSGLLSLYYVSFYFLYRGRLETFHVWLEYVPFYGMLAWEWWQGEYGKGRHGVGNELDEEHTARVALRSADGSDTVRTGRLGTGG